LLGKQAVYTAYANVVLIDQFVGLCSDFPLDTSLLAVEQIFESFKLVSATTDMHGRLVCFTSVSL
jgi:hypothetical protein